MTDYFLDYDGALSAKAQFGRRSQDLAGASATVLPADQPAMDVAMQAAHDLVRAFCGRLNAYGDELSMLSTLVSDTVTVTNQVDVDLSAATP